MSTIALVFPGQGSQSIGMGRALAERSPRAAAVWSAADDALGEALTTLAWEGDASQLDRTENAQPALLAASAAIASTLLEAWGADLRPAFFAGHSMGQYSAMVAAEVLSLPDAIGLVRERGRLMQAASGDGAMAAVIGLDDARLPDLEAAGSAAGVFAIANRNSVGQVVVSGERAAVNAAVDAAKALGAKRAIPLPVSVAAHSPLMAAAADGMRRAIADVEFRDPPAPLLANADARLLTTGDACREELIEHLTRGVDWVAAVERMRAEGVTTFVEAGPGKVLTGLIRRIAPDAQTIAADDPTADSALSPDAVALRSTHPTPA
jgi:[acyl-carrier-protein] S-malonyltransferase